MHIKIDSQTEELLNELGAKDRQAKVSLARQYLLEALENQAIRQRNRISLEHSVKEEVRKGLDSGPGSEWHDEDWEAVMRGKYKHEPEEDSWAVPPGWKSPRLKKDP